MKAAVFAFWASVVRTVVPWLVGTVAGWVSALGLTADKELEPTLTAALTLGLSLGFAAVYYVGARLLELYVTPRFGWLLGLAKRPVYEPRHVAK